MTAAAVSDASPRHLEEALLSRLTGAVGGYCWAVFLASWSRRR